MKKDNIRIDNSTCSFNFVDNIFNMVRTTDSRSGLLVIGQFIQEALDKGEKAVFISFSNPVQTLEVFKSMGFFFEEAILKENLIYLYYKMDFAETLSLSQDFKSIFDEVDFLGGGNVTNIAFENADVLLNTQSSFLIMSSVQKLATFSSNHKSTFLGQYIEADTQTSRYIDQTCKKILFSYYTLTQEGKVYFIHDHSQRSKGVARRSNIKAGKGFVRK